MTTGTSAASPSAASNRPVERAGAGLENWLRQLFPRHHLQDEFMHIGSIAAFLMALIGFVLGFFNAFNFLAVNFLLASVALSLFLILRESTLSHIRERGGGEVGSPAANTRYHAARRPSGSADLPPEAATTQSSPSAPRRR